MVYEACEGARGYARSELRLNRKEVRKEGQGVRSQSGVVQDLLRGDYESVLRDFQVRYALTTDFDLNAKFQKELSKIDKELKF